MVKRNLHTSAATLRLIVEGCTFEWIKAPHDAEDLRRYVEPLPDDQPLPWGDMDEAVEW